MIGNQMEFAFRYNILGMLSDEEVVRVSTAETARGLSEGDEYLDLNQLNRGVRLAPRAASAPACLLSRKAVCETTWSKVLAALEAYRTAALHFRVPRGTSRASG